MLVFKSLLRLNKVKPLYVCLAMACLGTTGCLPKDIASPEPSSSNVYDGFQGISSVETVADTRVLVKWKPSTDPAVVAYNIYDSTFRFNPKLIRTIAAPVSQVTLTGLATQSLYSFRVRAANEKNIEDSNVLDLQAIPYGGALSAEVISSTSAKINFTSAPAASEVAVFCKKDSADFELIGSVRNMTQTSLSLSNLVAGSLYTCRASVEIDGVSDNNMLTVQFTPLGQASQMAFTTQPSNAAAGQILSAQPVVTIRDVNGNVVAGGPDSRAIITLSVANSSPTAGIVNGTVSKAAVAGVASFSGININEAGTKILSASKEDTSGASFGTAPISATSDSFVISAGTVSKDFSTISISPTTPPSDPQIANGTDAYQITMRLRDQYGNPVVGVRPAFVSNVSGDILTQPTMNSDANGAATASISATVADTPPTVVRRISISTPAGLADVSVAAPFKHGVATRVAFTTQPVNSPAGIMSMSPMAVAIQDAQGNTVTTGANATGDITLSIASNVNGAIMTGTNPKPAVLGAASFTDIGIDRTGTAYRLIASSGSLSPAFSNTFNVTAGVPKKIAITGPANTLSGACSTAVTVALQDLGNNPANAIQNTPVVISGLGNASMYTASNCSGTALSTTMTFTAGTNLRTIYLKNNSAQAITMTGTDTSAVMVTGILATTFSPKKVGILAQAASPAPALTPLRVKTGSCSTEILITPMGANAIAGATFMPTTVSLTGLGSSPAQFYSDSGCTTLINPTSITLPINSGPDFTTKIYARNNLAETLSLSITDPSGILETTTTAQAVIFTPSTINLTGPASVVAGNCSSAFTVNLKDGLGNNATAIANTPLTINGVSLGSTGRFYTSSSCTGTGVYDTITFPASASVMLLYFRGTGSGTYDISLSDPAVSLATSQVVNIKVSPSALRLTAPVAGNANTNVCAGPFSVQTLDSLAQVSNAVTTINVGITGGGTSGGFYSDSSCVNAVTQVQFTTGLNQNSFYYKGYFPETSLTFTVTDLASVLTPATATWAVNGKQAWLGTGATSVNSSNNFLWFRNGAKPVAASYDGIFSATRLAMDPTNQFLYVTDQDNHRVIKYDYTAGSYVGWIGGFQNIGGIGIAGSNLTTPSSALCVSTTNNSATPGWCVGGQSNASTNNTTGRLWAPNFSIDDGNYLYVSNRNGQNISRYNSTTGAFAGYFGYITSNTGMTTATGGPSTCTTVGSNAVTPGWCANGTNGNHNMQSPTTADGRINEPRGIAYDSDYIYVLNRNNVTRHTKSTGAFTGWIGRVSTTPTGGDAGCTSRVAGDQTSGWCLGGASTDTYVMTAPIGGIDNSCTGIYTQGSELWIVRSNGVVMRYNRTTGVPIGALSSLAFNWVNTGQMATDGTKFYFADGQRIIKTDSTGLLESWMGKVATNTSMSGNSGCNTLNINDDTPGWCLGGTSRPGFEETSFRQLAAIVYDGNGKLLVGQGSGSGTVRRFNATTGAFEGTLSLESIGPVNWSNNSVLPTERNGFDDTSLFNPAAVVVSGEDLFIADSSAGRVKKMNRRTGAIDGWVGVVTTRPTGGLVPECSTANSFAASPGWCKGANFLPSTMYTDTTIINQTANGILQTPTGLATDSNFIYVADYNQHRITRFRISTGLSEGWIGKILVSPTGGDAGCNGATGVTPGWCLGGRATSGTGDGELTNPTSITVKSNILYVVDRTNERVVRFNALTGAFMGWIGRVLTAPSSGCTSATNGNYNVATNGWCLGGTSQKATTSDRGGGFNFIENQTNGLATDNTYLYITNFRNMRIDRYTFAGVFSGSTPSRDDIYTGAWTSNANTIGNMGASTCSYPTSIWTDGTNLYGTSAYPCTRSGDSFNVWKMNLSSGQMLGWQGGIFSSNLPFEGDAGCAGATNNTPGWCRGGGTTAGLRMGQFSGIYGFVGGDSAFIYVTDMTGNRVTRFPK